MERERLEPSTGIMSEQQKTTTTLITRFVWFSARLVAFPSDALALGARPPYKCKGYTRDVHRAKNEFVVLG